MNLPAFSDKEELAAAIHIDVSFVELFSRFSYRYYKRFQIKKSNGALREIRQPRKDLKAIQAWILRNILDKLTQSVNATAYIKGKGLVANVEPHSSNRFFLCLDLEDFFPSISIRRVKKLFSLIGYADGIAMTLAQICTCDGGLPQGAVTSPSLSNLIASKLDRRLSGYCSRRNITYTRYADDLTFSSNNPMALSKGTEKLLDIIKAERFKLNADKFRMLGPRRQCRITGLIKNSSAPKFSIGRGKKRRMRAIMHHLIKGAAPDKQYPTRASIEGWLSFLKSVDSEGFAQMSVYWGKLLKESA